MSSTPILDLPIFDLPFVVEIDARENGMDAVLTARKTYSIHQQGFGREQTFVYP